MTKRRDSSRPDQPDAPPEQAAVERAIRAVVERLKPKPTKAGQGRRAEGRPIAR